MLVAAMVRTVSQSGWRLVLGNQSCLAALNTRVVPSCSHATVEGFALDTIRCGVLQEYSHVFNAFSVAVWLKQKGFVQLTP
eukprot:6400448-Amphidinium_carterae.2